MKCFFCNREATNKVYTDIDGYQQQIDVCEYHLIEVKKFNFKQIFEQIINPFAATAFFMGENDMQKKSEIRPIENCKECYEIFHRFLMPLLKEIHEKYHTKRINGVGSAQLYKLKKDLEIALKEERYEDAAKLRDEIKKISGGDRYGKM
jgi:protein-arginine kinase activator protein McsA